MRKSGIGFLAISLVTMLASDLCATSILYDLAGLGGSRWEYRYTIQNDTPDPIYEFTIYFDYGQFAALDASTPAGWDGLTVEPQLIFGAAQDGFYDALAPYDALALSTGIPAGSALTGFSVAFVWLGADSRPGPQLFEILNPTDFSVLESGFTVPATAAVPEPSALWLLAIGVAALVFCKRQRPRLEGRNPD